MARSVRLIVPIVFFLIFQGAYAVDIHFSASGGGEYVGMTDSYDVDESVEVSGTSSASFDGGVSMTDSKSLAGSGDANINQVMFGSGGGADYVINYALETFGATSIEGSGSSTLTPVAGMASRSVSSSGSWETFSSLEGAQGGDFAGVKSYGQSADVSTSQRVVTGESVAATQRMNAEGFLAVAEGYAEDAEGNYVDIYARVNGGTLGTFQGVETTSSAAGHQKTVIDGVLAYALCEAYNPDQNYYAYVDNYILGNAYLDFEGEADVDDSEARAHQLSYAEGYFIYPWVDTIHLHNETSVAGSYNVESWALTNAVDEEVKLEVVSV